MNLRFLWLIVVGAVLTAGSARAQIPADPVPAVPTAAETQVVAVADTQTAVVAVAPGGSAPARDPFWPVGYVPRRPEKPAAVVVARHGAGVAAPAPPVAAPAVNPVDWDEARRKLDIRGISRIARDRTSGRAAFFAVVNNRMVEEGETVSVTWNGHVYRWRVTQIGPAGLQLVKIDARPE